MLEVRWGVFNRQGSYLRIGFLSLVTISCFSVYVLGFSFFLFYLLMLGISFGISVLSDYLVCG